MNYITKAIVRMAILISIMGVALGFLHQSLIHIFLHNIWLNGIIFFVIMTGIAIAFLQARRLYAEKKWLDGLSHDDRTPFQNTKHLKILAPFALILDDAHLPSYISPINARSVLVTIEGRLFESRDVTRYCIGLLVFLGLLGTFWGLSQTVVGISGVIGGIDMNTGTDAKNAFQTLKQGLNAPLSGMGTAFSCSMFGLAGSLVVGFLDLQVGRAAQAFYNDIEERLSSLTRFSPFMASQDGQAGMANPIFSTGLLEQVIEGMAILHEQLKKSEDSRLSMMRSIQIFSEKLSEMAEYMMAHQGFSQKLAQHQIELQEAILMESKDGVRGRNEEIMKTHLRSIDATLTKILEENIEGRAQNIAELKQEIRLITRTLSAIANGQDIS